MKADSVKIKKPKLLIVDDSSNNRAAISYWLNEENYEILHAVDGTSAIKIIEAFIPDIILLDYNLPGIDGIEVCQKIRTNKKLPFIPIVMMSSYAPEINVMALEQGADEFIAMPANPLELKSRLRAMLRLKEAIKESAELTKQNAKLQELDKIKSNLISKVSHELRTPLQAVLGYTDILKEGLQGELNYPQKLMVKQIREGGEKLLDIISQLLDFSNIEKGDVIFSSELLYVQSIFDHLSQITKPVATKKNINIEFILSNKEMEIQSDKNLVQQVLLNIISNSIKFSKENDVVSVSAKEINTDHIEFSVKDDGIGIPKSNIAYIFEKFWQGDDSLTRSYGGLGLGLALVKRLVTILGGQVSVESKPNEGSTFKVILPKEFKYIPIVSDNVRLLNVV